MAETDLPLAKDLLASREAQHYREPLIIGIFQTGITTDLLGAVRWIESLPYPTDHLACHYTVIQNHERRLLIDQLEEALHLATHETIRCWLADAVAEHYEETDETKLVKLAQSLDGESKKDVLVRLAEVYLDRDDPRADELIHELKGKVSIDESKVVRRNPARFLKAILPYVKDDFSRRSTTKFLTDDWFEIDPDGLRTWATENDPTNILELPAHQRTP